MKIDFSSVPYDAWYGLAVRWPLRLIPADAVVPILQGPLRGKKWIVGSSVHGCWLGSYEREKAELLKRRIQKGQVVFDIGAQAGFHTLLFSELTGPSGLVYAFEPAPRNLPYLHQLIQLHQLKNVVVEDAAVSDYAGTVHFDPGPSVVAGRISSAGSLQVRSVTLDGEIQSGRLPVPAFIKIDAEGAEHAILEGAASTLGQHHPEIVLDTHSFLGGAFAPLHEQCCRFLRNLGYRLQSVGSLPLEKSREIHAVWGA